MTVLFLCRANAGRSQIAEAFYNSLSEGALSAGVNLENSVMKDDLRVPPLVVEVMKEVGIDVTLAQRKKVTPEMVAGAKKVIALLSESEFPLPTYVTESSKFERWGDIPDAKGTDLDFHRKTRDVIKIRVERLLGKA